MVFLKSALKMSVLSKHCGREGGVKKICIDYSPESVSALRAIQFKFIVQQSAVVADCFILIAEEGQVWKQPFYSPVLTHCWTSENISGGVRCQNRSLNSGQDSLVTVPPELSGLADRWVGFSTSPES